MVFTNDALAEGDLSTQLIIVNSVSPAVATLSVAGRLWARRLRRVSYGIDDAIVVLTLVCGFSCWM